MRRVLACLSVAAVACFAALPPVACFAALPAASATPPPKDAIGQPVFGRAVINEIATGGLFGPREEFVEIGNPSRTESVDLTGWSIRVYSATNTLLQTIFFPEGASLLPLGAGPAEESLWTISGEGFTGVLVDQSFGFVDVPVRRRCGAGGAVTKTSVAPAPVTVVSSLS